MTTARQLIIDYLQAAGDFVQSGDIHNHVTGFGYQRNTSEGVLSKMVARGIVLRVGKNHSTYCKISPSFRQGNCKASSRTGRPMLASAQGNVVFDEYRANSQVYQMDQYLRGVRNARNMVHP